MRVYWGIHRGESIEVYDGAETNDVKATYRIGVERVVGGEVKIVRPHGSAKIINNGSTVKILDVTTRDSLYIEFLGADGFAYGWYEFLAAL